MAYQPSCEAPLQNVTARNRENQRNFRARRQQYIRDLEQKVQTYEAAQVSASQHVQEAAREVVEENRVLRYLLRARFGVSEEDIHQAVRELRPGHSRSLENTDLARNPVGETDLSSQISSTIPAHRPNTCSITATTPAIPATSQTPLCTQPSQSPIIPATSQNPSPTHPSQDTPRTMPEPLTHSPSVPAPCHPPKLPTAIDQPDQISCDEAASIIASIRAHPSVVLADIRQELGCGVLDRCNVANKDVFHVIGTYV